MKCGFLYLGLGQIFPADLFLALRMGFSQEQRCIGYDCKVVHYSDDYIKGGKKGEEMVKVGVMFTEKYNCNMVA